MNVEPWQPVSPALSAASFHPTLAPIALAVVHFWAVWDHLDRTLDARLQSLRPQFEPPFRFFSFDTDPEANWPICREFQPLVPVLICFRYGKQLGEKKRGLRDEAALATILEDWRMLVAGETGDPATGAE